MNYTIKHLSQIKNYLPTANIQILNYHQNCNSPSIVKSNADIKVPTKLTKHFQILPSVSFCKQRNNLNATWLNNMRTTGMVRFHRQHLQSVTILKLLQGWSVEAGHFNPKLTMVLFNNKCFLWIQILWRRVPDLSW